MSSINNRFSGANEVLKDLSLLSPERLMSFKNKTIDDLPSDSFVNLSSWLEGINIDILKNEYIMISQSLKDLIINMALPERLHKSTESLNQALTTDTEDTSTEYSENNDENEINNKEKITAINIIKMLNSFNLESAFPNIALAYKALGTIPATSASAERSFSKV